jgi:hypothetical protein
VATRAQVRRIALALPGVVEDDGHFAFGFPHRGKVQGFVWVWMERLAAKKPRLANESVIAVRVANLAQRDVLIAADPVKFFTEPHYEGYPAVLVRLPAVSVTDLRVLLEEGWRTKAPKALLKSAQPNAAPAKPVKRARRMQ